MKKSDLSPDRQKRLVPVEDYPGAWALVPPPTPHLLDLAGACQTELIRAREALALLEEISARLPNPALLTRTVDRREAVRSSQIEGTNADMDDLFTYEATGSAEGLPADVHVTRNYVLALEDGLRAVRAGGVEAISTRLIRELHARLMEGVDYPGPPGAFREKQNWIGGGTRIYDARVVPPPVAYLQDCMTDLEGLLQYSAADEVVMVPSIIIRMAIAHAQFETIHPFIDGNGRLGRILMPLMLAAEGYPPVYLAGYLKEHQQDYYDALAGVQLQDRWADWVGFFALGVEAAAQEAIRTGLALEKLLTNWQEALAGLGLRSHSAVHKFPAFMIGTPVVTAHKAKDALGISFPSASAALARLAELRIVKQKNAQRRNRVFVATEVIDILNRPPSRGDYAAGSRRHIDKSTR